MVLLTAQISSDMTVKQILQEADNLGDDAIVFQPSDCQRPDTCLVLLSGPNAKAYKQALIRTQDLLAEDDIPL